MKDEDERQVRLFNELVELDTGSRQRLLDAVALYELLSRAAGEVFSEQTQ